MRFNFCHLKGKSVVITGGGGGMFLKVASSQNLIIH